MQKFAYHGSYVGCCAFNRTSTLLATGSNDRTVAVWQVINADDDKENNGGTGGANSRSVPFATSATLSSLRVVLVINEYESLGFL